MFSRSQVLILKTCAVVIGIGSLILAVDRFVIRGDEPSIEQQRADVVAELGLEVIRDRESLTRLESMLRALEPLKGRVTRIDAVLRHQQLAASVWLVEFQSRHASRQDRMISRQGVEVPHFLILIELSKDPGWPGFLQLDPAEFPGSLPADWHSRLAGFQPYRIGIESSRIAFVSQIEGSALVEAIGAADRPEFYPGLLSSALRIEVQQALDIVGAMPGAPKLGRF